MSETYIDVPVAEVKVGDQVKIAQGHNGFSKSMGQSTKGGFGFGFFTVSEVTTNWVELLMTSSCPEWIVTRSSIVAARRRVEVVPREERCGAAIKPCVVCSLRKEHTGDHIGYEAHEIGVKETGRAPNQTKAETCGHTWVSAPHLVTSCARFGVLQDPAHTPKEPKREAGCGKYGPDLMRYCCISHEDGFHVSRSGDRVFKRWPIEAPEPMPNGNLPGDWATCIGGVWVYHGQRCPKVDGFEAQRRVYRSTVWSKDERTRERRAR